MNVLFWLSIGLWLLALLCYAMILSANEQLHRRGAGMPTFASLETLIRRAGGSGARRYLYRTLLGSAVGAMLTGGLYLLTRSD